MNMSLIFFPTVYNGTFLLRDLLSQLSLEQTRTQYIQYTGSEEQTTEYNDCLENIVLNEKNDSEHEDNLEIAEWREDKMGSLFVLYFYLPERKCWW